MLLRHRSPGIESRPANTTKGFEHLDEKAIAVMRWLTANHVDYVLVGSVAAAIRGDTGAKGPVAIVPAPYGRNFDRLAHALSSAHARLRIDGGTAGSPTAPDTMPVKLTAEKLARGQRWTLRCGIYDVDIEGRQSAVPRYQELLYEAGRFELTSDLSVEVGSPEDIEHYEHVRRTGVTPEIRITRNASVKPG
jgi:hypothetical protein